ncbi:MAG TPA: YggS family pyridoxal phosphate-dependent enzyme [Nitrospiraceae bacterium]|nr:YggS family pyridoxal phosphate-dependent enzyme [Nitrospiraceae bacterium]
MDLCPGTIAGNVAHILDNIRSAAVRSGRRPDLVRLVAATKLVPPDRIVEVLAAGVTILGENRLQEALPKIERLGQDPIVWHFIGRLQRRKVKAIVGRFALIHSVESIELAEEINRRAAEAGIRQAVLLEVNMGEEASKGGFPPQAVAEACRRMDGLAHVAVKGLMTIPPPDPDVDRTRMYFRRLRELAHSLTQTGWEHINMDELSMGMSADYRIAVEEGATLVRIGTAIFGARGSYAADG